MLHELNISYVVFEEEGVKVLTVSRGDEALHMFHGDEAEELYLKLIDAEKKEDKETCESCKDANWRFVYRIDENGKAYRVGTCHNHGKIIYSDTKACNEVR